MLQADPRYQPCFILLRLFIVPQVGPGGASWAARPGLLLEWLFRAWPSPLADAEDHELGRLDRRHADFNDQTAEIARLGRVELVVALDVEGFFRRAAEQRPIPPDGLEE